MIRICQHIFRTNFCILSSEAKLLWFFAAVHADHDGVVNIHYEVLPKLAGLNDAQSTQATEELSKHNFYDNDQSPFLSKHETDEWHVSKVLLWKCRQCELATREFIPLEVRQKVLSIGFCVHCHDTRNLEVDHIRPVSFGGSSDIENLQVLCRTCNRSKLNRFIG